MKASIDYLNTIRSLLDHYERTQMDAIERAAEIAADSVLNGGAVHLASIGHSNEQDFLNRAGGPAFLQALSFSMSINDPVADCLKNRPRGQPAPRRRCSRRIGFRTKRPPSGHRA